MEGARATSTVECDIQSLRRAGHMHEAAARGIRAYGPEIMGFLVTVLRSDADAGEVFAQASEDLWRGFARFEERSSFRTWYYAIARNAAIRYRRTSRRASAGRAPLSEADALAAARRSTTVVHLRSETRDRFAAIRDGLADDDRVLLVLRIDRGMAWNDVARVFSTGVATDEDVACRAARLRKRYQLLKDEIRARIESDPPPSLGAKA
jgi:RNA polymerase sigma-70 factor (ECF subfamily)